MRTTRLRGARTNNLASVDLDLAPGSLVAIAGPSGAGKSSLAFGTLYAEGQRRYVESFSAYARQYLERLARPPVESLDPVPAAIAVDRQAPVRSSRSTVATMTDLADYVKALYARLATLHCPDCDRPVTRDVPEASVDAILARHEGRRAVVTYSLPVRDATEFLGVREALLADGYRRVFIAGETRDLDETRPSDVLPELAVEHGRAASTTRSPHRDEPSIERKSSEAKTSKKVVTKRRGAASLTTASLAARSAGATQSVAARSITAKANVDDAGAANPAGREMASAEGGRAAPARLEVVADRTVITAAGRGRLTEALEAAFSRGNGHANVHVEHGDTERLSSGLHCAYCDRHFREPSPALFSFNSPIGACETCRGFGRTIGIDWARVFPDDTLTLAGGAIRPWQGKSTQWERKALVKHAARAGVPLDVPLGALTEAQRTWLVEGEGRGWSKGWFGLRAWFAWLETRTYKMHVRVLLSRYRTYEPCQACGGSRFRPEALAYRLAGHSLPAFYGLTVEHALAVVRRLLAETRDPPALLALRESEARLATLADVGLGYLALDRASRTLSGGEAQRVGLASALSASLAGALFVLDEPTIGLHPRDVRKLFDVVGRLARGDDVVVVIEHDLDFLAGVDRVVELGPGAGEHGGRVVYDGSPAALVGADTATGRALARKPVHARHRRRGQGELAVRNARGHNLRGVDLVVPIAAMTCVTGPSGSGKSSLVLETLAAGVGRALGTRRDDALPHDALEGAADLAGLVVVDQSPLGRTSRGNPATYVGAWDVVRKRFAAEPLAKERGYGPGYFSFNVEGGRCPTCKGEGAETVEMQFLADVSFSCPECGGRRFTGAALDVRHRELDVAEVLELTVAEALARFEGDRELTKKLAPLGEVGLGYLRLGQPLSTLSGGEAQRLKLAVALAEGAPGSLLVLDEPTAGLHPEDVEPLLRTFDRLVERGDTLVVVEHDVRVAAMADWVVDLGPGAGPDGGFVVAAGTPEVVAKRDGPTAPYLRAALGMDDRGALTSERRTRRADPVLRDADRAALPSARAALSPGRVELDADRVASGSQRAALERVVDVRGSDPAERVHPVVVEGAREHNLRDVGVAVPREQLVVVTGPSGSGKSSLAFDVIYAEGQRRYLETLSPYARQYLPQLPRPAVDRIVGIPPCVSLEQRTTRGGSNSTVATLTEVAHYVRLLFARAGLLHCVDCGVPIAPRSASAIAGDLEDKLAKNTEVAVFVPVVRGKKGLHKDILARALAAGREEAIIDGAHVRIAPKMSLDRHREHDVDVLVGRAKVGTAALRTALATALDEGEGAARVAYGDALVLVSSKRACPSCGRGYPELDPRFFSFNTRQGACEGCDGRGVVVRTIGRGKSAREESSPCLGCGGTRLSKLARSVTVAGVKLEAILGTDVRGASQVLDALEPEGREAAIAKAPLSEARRRLSFLRDIGLDYLGLDRAADTLSGGEMQRVRLAAQLGSGLTGVLYVLDEPTIGLHPRDTGVLIDALSSLVARGSSVLVVEHDLEVVRAAHHVIDVGPGGGRHGGTIVAEGAPNEVARDPRSATGRALARAPRIPERRRPVEGASRLRLFGARAHNLAGVDLDLPLGRLVAVTGVSGSGKSTLVRRVLLPATRRALGLTAELPGAYDRLTGASALDRAIEIDQTPIGRTPRSVPATYIGIWDELRKLLAATPEARARGYGPSRFSFNVATGGRCTACAGQGALSVEMSFLPDVLVPCESCGGARFDRETLEVRLHGHHAGEILDLEVEDARRVFAQVPKVATPLALLDDLGLGYLKLGQPSNTLSGGEAQRLKLVSELAAHGAGRTLYVMDEPTTGLHRDDVARLITLLERLVDRGDTVVVVEHHTDVILAADHVIDLGPEGGQAGGHILAVGTPEQIVSHPESHTGKALAQALGQPIKPPSSRRLKSKTARPQTAGAT